MKSKSGVILFMQNEFDKLSLLEKKKLTIEELCEYKRKLRKYQVETNQKIKGIEVKKVIHPIINFLIKGRRIFANQTLTCYKSNQEEVKQLRNKKEIVKNLKRITRPIIFAITHTGKYDIEIVNEVITVPYYLLSDDEEYMYRTIDGYITELNGVIYVDSDYPEDLKVAKETSIKVLNQGGNVMWFPEGIWNLSPNQLILPCKYGIIDVAKETGAVIVPIAIDQKDKDFYVNVGKEIYPEDLKINTQKEKIESINYLKDILSTLKWQIWERFPIEKRNDIPSNYYENFIEEKIAEWPFFTIQDIEKRVFKPKNMITYEEVLIEPLLRAREYKENQKVLKKSKTEKY